MAEKIDLPNGKTLTADDIIRKAEREVSEEVTKDLVRRAKAKLTELTKAKQLVANIEREYEALKLEIQDALGE